MEYIDKYLNQIVDLILIYGGRLLLAIIVLIVGLWLVKRFVTIIGKGLDKRNVDPSLKPFLKSILGALLKIMLFISVAGMVGVEMTSFIAVLGAAGLAVGLALQGSLSNFAGGVLILLLKPFKVGDFIEGAGHAGTVHEIQIFYTYLTNPSNQEIIIPNGKLSNDSVKNYSFHATRRMDMTYGISYADDIDKAKAILWQLVEAEERFMEDPAKQIFVEALADSSVNFKVRVWTKNSDYWDIFNNFSEKVKKAFDAAGVSIPFPQRDVHFYNENGSQLGVGSRE